MIVRRPTVRDVFHVALHMRERDYEEIICLTPFPDRIALAEFLSARYGNAATGSDLICLDSGEPVGVLSFVELRPSVWSVGLFGTDDLARVVKSVTSYIVRVKIPLLDAAGCHRLECQSIVGYDEIHRWLRFLGLEEEERGLIRKMGRGGEDFISFAWVRPDGVQSVRWAGPGRIEDVHGQ